MDVDRTPPRHSSSCAGAEDALSPNKSASSPLTPRAAKTLIRTDSTGIKLSSHSEQDSMGLGISLHYLQTQFLRDIRECDFDPATASIYDIDKRFLRGQLLEDVVDPADDRKGGAYINLVQNRDKSAVNEATVFLSYCWGYTVAAIVDALGQIEQVKRGVKDPKDVYVWICCLCCNQFRIAERSSVVSIGTDTLVELFGGRVLRIGHVAMMMSPWDAPLYFTRVWCIFELAVAIIIGCSYEVVMTNADEDLLEQSLAERFTDVMGTIATIDIRNASASCDADRVNIFSLIEKRLGGSDVLNSKVVHALREWLLRMSTSRLKQKQVALDARSRDSLDAAVHMLRLLSPPRKSLSFHEDAIDSFSSSTGKEDKVETEITLLMRDLDVLRMGCGHLHQHLGANNEAKKMFEQCLEFRVKAFGENHKLVAESLINLADLQRIDGDLSAAESLLKRAKFIQECVFGMEAPGVAATLTDLGRVVAKLRRFEEAEVLYQNALDILSNHDLPQHIATVLNNLGRLYVKQSKFELARVSLRQSIAILEGIESDSSQSTMSELAAALTNMATISDHKDAAPLFDRALQLRKAMYGESHSEFAAALNNYGSWFQSDGQYSEAEKYFRYAHSVWTKCCGSDHPDVSVALSNIASALHAQRNSVGFVNEVIDSMQDAIEIKQKCLPRNHPDLGLLLINFAGILIDRNENLDLAKDHVERARQIFVEVHGEDHAEVAECLGLQAKIAEMVEPNSEADSKLEVIESLHMQRIETLIRCGGFCWNLTETAIHDLVRFYRTNDQFHRAIELLQRSYDSLVSDPDINTSDNLKVSMGFMTDKNQSICVYGQSLSQLLFNLGESKEAEDILRKCLRLHSIGEREIASLYKVLLDVFSDDENRALEAIEISETLLDLFRKSDSWENEDTLSVLRTQGSLYKKQKLYEKSQQNFSQCVTLSEAIYGKHTKETANALNSWGTSLKKLGKLQEARVAYSHSLAVYSKLYGPDHPHVKTVQKNLNSVQRRLTSDHL